MPRYDSNMREKCRQAALQQHKNMTVEQKQKRTSITIVVRKRLGKGSHYYKTNR